MRKFARELGADINTIHGSEKYGRVSEDDVKSFIKHGINKLKLNMITLILVILM